MKVLKLTAVMLAISAVILTGALVVYMNMDHPEEAVHYAAADNTPAPAASEASEDEPESNVDSQVSDDEDEDAEWMPDPDPSQLEQGSHGERFNHDDIYGTWVLFEPENPEEVIERITYNEDGSVETIRKPGTEFERSFTTYYRVKPYEDQGFILYTYIDKASYEADDTNSLETIGLFSGNILPLYTVIMPSGHVMADQPRYIRKI